MRLETKAEIGSEIFFLENNRVTTATIKHIQINIKEEPTQFGTKFIITTTYNTDRTDKLLEQDIFLSKQSLLDSL